MSLLSPPLQAFIAVAKHKTVHAAADQLHLTQTAITQRIKSLENQLKTCLFLRSRRGMLLTPEGEALLRYCHASLDLEGEALAHITGSAKESLVRMTIASPSTILDTRILPSCKNIMHQFPNLLLQFSVSDIENRHHDLKNGTAQLAILQPEDLRPEMASKKLKPEQYILVCSSKWKNRKLKEILTNERIIDFNPEDEITFHYLRHFGLFEFAKKERHFINRIECLAELIHQGLGYTTLTKEFAEPYINKKQLYVLNQGKLYSNDVLLAWYPRPNMPDYFSALINAID